MDRSCAPRRIAVTLEQCWHRVPGGTARAALETTEAVRRTGEVTLIGVAAAHRSAPPAPWVPTIAVARLPLPRLVLYEAWHRFGRPTVEHATGPVEVIHVTGFAMPPPTAPIVVTLHDLAFLRYPDYFTRNGLRFFHAALDRMRRDAAVVLCSSQATRADAVAAGIDDARIRVVPLGVAAPRVHPERVAAVRRRFDLPGRYVLHLGTAEPRKNIGALTRIADRLPDDVTVVLAGGAGWGSHGAATGTRVRHLGWVSEAEKWALLTGAAVFCYPSLWEGFGLPVAEAMAVGTPVVTSAGTSLAEVVADAGVCVDPHDPDALAGAVRDLLDDPTRAAELAAAGRNRAAELTWARNARATLDAYARAGAR